MGDFRRCVYGEADMEKHVLAKDHITQGVIWKEMMLFFLPIMLGTLLQQLYNAADAIIIGRALGKEALAAVGGSSTSIIALLVNFFVALASGASVVISQSYGAGRAKRVREGIYCSLFLAVACGTIVTVLGVVGARPLLLLLHTTENTIEGSTDYLQIYFLGMIPTMLYNMGSGVLRAMGDAKKPLLFLGVCIVANVGLDLLFVMVFRWGIVGAAAATALSQVMCAVMVLLVLSRLPEDLRPKWKGEHFNRLLLYRMIQIGLPAGIQSSMYSIANMLVQSAINSLGTDAVAGWTAYRKIDDIYWPISNAIGISIMTFVGQNYGAKKIDRVKGSIRAGMVIHIGVSAFFSLVTCLLRYPLIRLFIEDEAVIQVGTQVALMTCSCFVLFSCTEVFSSSMRGVGNALKPAIITLCTTCVARILYLWLYGFDHASNAVIAFCFPFTWALSSVVFTLYYRFGHWMPRSAAMRQTEKSEQVHS